MNENRLIEEFWKDCEIANFSKEATVLFFHLLFLCRQNRQDTVYLHPAALLSKVKGFAQTAVIAASEELQKRGYIEFQPADEERTSGCYMFVKSRPTTKKGIDR